MASEDSQPVEDPWDGPPTEAYTPTADISDEPSFFDSLYRTDEVPTADAHPAASGTGSTPVSPRSPLDTGPRPSVTAAPPTATRTSPALVVVTVVLVLLAASAIGALVLFGDREPVAAPRPTAATLPPTPASPSPTPRPTASPQEDPVFPADAGQCAEAIDASTQSDGSPTHAATGSDATSCEFAAAVLRAYAQQPLRSGPVTITAFSPITGKDYDMSCDGTAPVVCTGGNNAVVYLG